MICPNCGIEKKTENAAFCVHCGHPFVKSSETMKKKAKGKWAVLVAVVIAVIGIIVAFAVPRDESGSSDNEDNIHKSAKKVAIAGFEAEYEGKAEDLIEAYPDFEIRHLAWSILHIPEDSSKKEIVKALKEYFRYEDTYKIKILDAEVVSEWNVEDNPVYLDLFDETEEEYEQMQKLAKVEITFEESEEDGWERTVEVLCVKMNKKWYYLCEL